MVISAKTIALRRHAVAWLDKTLHYKPESRGFDSLRVNGICRSGRIMAQGSTQPLAEMCTKDNFWAVKVAGVLG